MNRLLHVDCPTTFPDVPSKFHVSSRRLWSRLSIPQGLVMTAGWLGTCDNFPLQIDSTSCNSLESFIQFTLSCNSCIKSSLTFSQFMPGEFVNSHFLSPLQFFYFTNTSNVSFSKCFFSLRKLFVKPGLLSSRCFISTICIFNFRTIGTNLSFKLTNGTVKKVCSTFLFQHFRFCLCE